MTTTLGHDEKKGGRPPANKTIQGGVASADSQQPKPRETSPERSHAMSLIAGRPEMAIVVDATPETRLTALAKYLTDPGLSGDFQEYARYLVNIQRNRIPNPAREIPRLLRERRGFSFCVHPIGAVILGDPEAGHPGLMDAQGFMGESTQNRFSVGGVFQQEGRTLLFVRRESSLLTMDDAIRNSIQLITPLGLPANTTVRKFIPPRKIQLLIDRGKTPRGQPIPVWEVESETAPGRTPARGVVFEDGKTYTSFRISSSPNPLTCRMHYGAAVVLTKDMPAFEVFNNSKEDPEKGRFVWGDINTLVDLNDMNVTGRDGLMIVRVAGDESTAQPVFNSIERKIPKIKSYLDGGNR